MFKYECIVMNNYIDQEVFILESLLYLNVMFKKATGKLGQWEYH